MQTINFPNNAYHQTIQKQIRQTVLRESLKAKISIVSGIIFSFLASGLWNGLSGVLESEDHKQTQVNIMLSMASIITVAAAILIFRYFNYRKNYADYEKLRRLIGTDPGSFTVRYLAREFGTAYDTMLKKLDTLIDKKYLPDYYINYAIGCLMPTQNLQQNRPEQQYIYNLQKLSVFCKNCGGSTHIRPGQKYICQYCGSSLSTK